MYISYISSELERERVMRLFIFPRLKRSGKLTDSEAALRLARLDAAIELCDTLIEHGVDTVAELPLRLTGVPALNKMTEESSPLNIIKGGE